MSTGSLLTWCRNWIGSCGQAAGLLWLWCVGESRPTVSEPPRPVPTAAPELVLRPTAKPSPRRPRWYSPPPAQTLVHVAEDPPRHIPVIPIETSFEWEILGARTADRLSALLPVFLEPLMIILTCALTTCGLLVLDWHELSERVCLQPGCVVELFIDKLSLQASPLTISSTWYLIVLSSQEGSALHHLPCTLNWSLERVPILTQQVSLTAFLPVLRRLPFCREPRGNGQ